MALQTGTSPHLQERRPDHDYFACRVRLHINLLQDVQTPHSEQVILMNQQSNFSPVSAVPKRSIGTELRRATPICHRHYNAQGTDVSAAIKRQRGAL